MIEHSSIHALCKEIEVRMDLGAEILIFPPSITTAQSLEKGEDDHGGETAKFRELVSNANHVFFVMWADEPRHYTYIYTKRPEPGSRI